MRLSTRSAKRSFAEFLLIVAGVLAALAVDAWWQGHSERVREGEYLDQVLADLRDNQLRLDEALVVDRGQLQRAGAMLIALRDSDAMHPDSASSWMSRDPTFPWYSDPRLRVGTLVALVQGGDINIIRDAGTRSAAVAYLGQVEADLVEFRRGVDLFQHHSDDLYRLLESARPDASDVGGDQSAMSLLRLQGNVEAARIMRSLRADIENRVWYLDQMLQATKRFIAVLDTTTAVHETQNR